MEIVEAGRERRDRMRAEIKRAAGGKRARGERGYVGILEEREREKWENGSVGARETSQKPKCKESGFQG
eukprot:1357049-Amorphochlora_amoeboformis.AAC.1